MKIKEICAEERPREKMLAKGAEAMSNSELLAILIGSGTRKENVLEVANRLLSKTEGRLKEIARMNPEQMKSLNGIGSNKYAAIVAAFELGKRCWLEDAGISKISITDAGMVYRVMIPYLKGLGHEEFWVVFLNKANYVIHKEMMSLGGTDCTIIDTKLVIKRALDFNACGIIMVHNHPSGNPRPGHSDITQTELMKKAAVTFGISLLDHIIICDDSYFSFSEERVAMADNGAGTKLMP